MTRKPSKGVPGPRSTAAERVVWLLETVWDGNRNAMAEAVEVTHSVLVKIAAGQQGPGRRLLDKIATHPKVNPAWLFTGEGEPLVAPKGDMTEGWPLPVAYEPLPGPVEKNRDKLSEDVFVVAGRFYRSSRYWLRPRGTYPVTKDPSTGVLPRDLMLIETDADRWALPEYVNEHFCILRTKGDLEIRRVHWHASTEYEDERTHEYFEADTHVRPERPAGSKVTLFLPDEGKPRVSVEALVPGKPAKGQFSVAASRFTTEIDPKDIVGVCVLVVRDF